MSAVRGNSCLFPFANIDEAVEQLSQRFDHPVTVDNINVILRGFKTIYRDTNTRDQYIYGDVLEESRAAIIQTVLNDIIVGQQVSPFASPENQYAAGIRALQGSMIVRRESSQGFIDTFVTSAKDIRKGMERLFKGLYYNDVTTFVLSLSPSESGKFTSAVLGSIEEQERRMSLQR